MIYTFFHEKNFLFMLELNQNLNISAEWEDFKKENQKKYNQLSARIKRLVEEQKDLEEEKAPEEVVNYVIAKMEELKNQLTSEEDNQNLWEKLGGKGDAKTSLLEDFVDTKEIFPLHKCFVLHLKNKYSASFVVHEVVELK